MVHCNAIIKHRSTISHFIGPVIKDAVVQLGESEPEAMAMAMKIMDGRKSILIVVSVLYNRDTVVASMSYQK